MTTQPSPSANDLVRAIDRTPEVIDRRKSSDRRTAADRRKNPKQSVGIEISPFGISLAAIRSSTDNQEHELVNDFYRFDSNSAFAEGDWNSDELNVALASLVEKHRLAGQSVTVGLGGKPCVTRALIGDNDEVDADIREISERADRYLSLGFGSKVCCYADLPINAKRKRAWVTIANRVFVEAVADAVAKSGLRLTRIEHTLTSYCQMIGSLGLDAERPILLVQANDQSAVMAISYQGQLLLDYRPVERSSEGNDQIPAWAMAVAHHIKCLRRYLQKQVSADVGELQKIVLPGSHVISETLSSQLRDQHGLEVMHLTQSQLTEGLKVDEKWNAYPELLAAIWLAKTANETASGNNTNLLESLQARQDVRWVDYAKAFWPIAAVLAFAIASFAWTRIESSQLERLEERLAEYTPTRLESGRIMASLAQNTEYLNAIDRLHAKIPHRSWSKTIGLSGQLLPQGVWMESLAIDSDASVTWVGSSFTEDGIYDFIAKLGKNPQFGHVTLRSTQEVRLKTGPAIRFEVVAVAREKSAKPASDVAKSVGSGNSSESTNTSGGRKSNG